MLWEPSLHIGSVSWGTWRAPAHTRVHVAARPSQPEAHLPSDRRSRRPRPALRLSPDQGRTRGTMSRDMLAVSGRRAPGWLVQQSPVTHLLGDLTWPFSASPTGGENADPAGTRAVANLNHWLTPAGSTPAPLGLQRPRKGDRQAAPGSDQVPGMPDLQFHTQDSPWRPGTSWSPNWMSGVQNIYY